MMYLKFLAVASWRQKDQELMISIAVWWALYESCLHDTLSAHPPLQNSWKFTADLQGLSRFSMEQAFSYDTLSIILE